MANLFYAFSTSEVPNYPDVNDLSAAACVLELGNEHISVSDFLDPPQSDKVLMIFVTLARIINITKSLGVIDLSVKGSESSINNYLTKFQPDVVDDYTFKNTQGVSIVKNSSFDQLDQEIKANAIETSGRAMQVPNLPADADPPLVYRYRGVDFLEEGLVGQSLNEPAYFYLWREIKTYLNQLPKGIRVQTVSSNNNLAQPYADQALVRKIKKFERRVGGRIGDTFFARVNGLYVEPSA